MNRVLSDVIHSGKMYLRSPIGAFFTLAFPVLLILLFGAIFTGDGMSTITLHVQDLDDGIHSDSLIEILNSTDLVRVKLIPESEDITKYIRDNSLTVALLIPANFSTNIDLSMLLPGGPPASVQIYGDPSSSLYGTAFSAVNFATTAMNYNLAGIGPIILMDESAFTAEHYTFMDFFLPGIVGLTVMTTCLFGVTSMCAEYRSRGYFKLLATTTLKKSEWLASRFIIYTLLLLVSLMMTLAVGVTLFEMHATLTLTAILFIMVGVLMFSGLGMLLGTVIRDPETGVAISNAIGFPMMFLSGTFFAIEAFPPYLQTVAHLLPLTYLNDGLRATMIYGSEAAALTNLGITAAVAAVFFTLASILMSWKER